MICNKLGGGENVKNIIVLEDNPKINKILQDILINEGYSVFSSFNAFEALKDFNANSIDCILTDLMLPIMSGEEFIQEIRKTSNVHIIVISAKNTDFDKIDALKKGADDYLIKPFLEDELVIKLDNLFTKKDYNKNTTTFNKKQIIFEEGKPQIVINSNVISLTGVEYQILHLLINENNKVISREQFLNVLYNHGGEVFDRVIDVHITNIRKKINKFYPFGLIKTVYGLGYSLVGELDE
jgi:DNA-binding response OmpR family regulator